MKLTRLAFIVVAMVTPLLAQGDFQKGISYYKQGNCEKAVVEFETIVKANPKYEDGLRVLGDCYLMLRKYDEAIGSFREALKLRSDRFVTYYGLALAYFNAGKFQDAAATLQRGERFLGNFDRYKFYHLRGSAFYNSGQYGAAVNDLNEAVRARAAREDLLQLAQAHRELGNEAETQNAFRRVLAIDPGNRLAQEAIANSELKSASELIEQRRFADAIAVLSEYVKRNPGNGGAFYNLGLAYLFTDRFREAEEAFAASANLTPTAAAFDRLGFIQEKQRKYTQALASYKRSGELGEARASENVKRVQQRMAQEKSGSPEVKKPGG